MKRLPVKINPPVFFSSALLTLVFVSGAMIAPEAAERIFTHLQTWVIEEAGWFYILAVALFLMFVVFLAFSEYGNIKLGPDHSEPDYSYTSWFAMLFSAGMGIGLMFFGVAEPVMHTMTPPHGDGGTVEAAREAMRITYFHWGIHAWAIYAVVALSLAYFSFRQGLPLTIRSALYPIIGERIHGPIGHTVDVFAVLGTLFGVATSLGFGVIQVNSGLNYLFGLPVGPWVQVGLIAGITALATTSVVLGLDGGIRRISELNMVLAGALLLFVLLLGPTVFLLQTYIQNIGHYLSEIVETTFNLYAYRPTDWIGGWTLFYWGWWIAWSPFVGMFIARVSRGRTIREFVVGVLLVPSGFTFMWMTFFGDSALWLILNQGATELARDVAADTSVALFKFFEHFPLSEFASGIATLLVVTFFVTSSDSGSLVVDMLTSGGEEEAPVWQRIFWAVTEGFIAAALLVAGGLQGLQTATITSALPFAVIMLVMCWGLLKALRLELVKRHSLRQATTTPLVGQNPIPWQQRLRRVINHPQKQVVVDFIQKDVVEALNKFADVMGEEGMVAEVKTGDDGRAWLEVSHHRERDFVYSVRPIPQHAPAFIMRDTRSDRGEKLRYYRAEVFLQEGGQDYDIMQWNQDQILADVIDQYEKHMYFLNQLRAS
ncbi:BCCT family transporter [Parahaliea mediterranea]|uniref:Choline BCCT transporter BetT n=1 Tax=Parahaliea mediterranea TaxID=651086 RepID=A0A939DEN7_9GAMM|nr:choline BCCT transporter BetT [Parahaliea mediterranea]MBN7796806.1 choline BCCT transporter BetT [Parahaliea mediterranea]